MCMILPSKEAMTLLKVEYGQKWNEVIKIQGGFYDNN